MVAHNAHMTSKHRVADTLLSLSDGGLAKLQLKDYVVLEKRLGRSAKHKNAVSVLREGVSFMVGDWTQSEKAEGHQLACIREEETKLGKRLVFPELSSEVILQHQNFFRELVSAAAHEAEIRQSQRKV